MKIRPVQQVIEGRDMPLPYFWADFMTLSENKADLAFLSEELLANAPCDKEIVVSSSFKEEEVR